MRVLERPPLGLSYIAESPEGVRHRWGDDADDPAMVPTDVSFGDAMPGGYDKFAATLPREAGVDYSDLELFSTIFVRGFGGEPAAEYMLERAPKNMGTRVVVGPEARGWQAHLDHNRQVRVIYIDQDLNVWEGPSASMRIVILGLGETLWDHSVAPDRANGQPRLIQGLGDSGASAARSDAFYVSPDELGEMYYAFVAEGGLNPADVNWLQRIDSAFNDDMDFELAETGNLIAASGSGYVVIGPPGAGRKVVRLLLRYGTAVANYAGDSIRWFPAMYGNNGLEKRGGTDPKGFWASDIVAHAVGKFAPLLNFTTGVDGSIVDSDFVLQQAAYRDATTTAEIVKDANRVHLHDWAVWDRRTFYYHPRRWRGRRWYTRGVTVEEAGLDADRVWESITVQYQETSGETRTVGPPGSGADVESDLLRDDDPDSPAVKLGAPKRDRLEMGVSTAPVAIEVGRRFLAETKLLDRSGSATLKGYVSDERGNEWPYWMVKSGDEVVFADAADPSPRRVVSSNKSPREASCSVNLDAPPEGLAALLERLGAVIAPMGF